uniref:Uncharacterized protein n=1 Tax=Branchiostoma floridae TaxID=7739 RepID=C3YY04_BRAFL|eukprot:XP_002598951.1 hypothetical protein BRAFLDRAFT_79883 [Branchiostoma floridae]
MNKETLINNVKLPERPPLKLTEKLIIQLQLQCVVRAAITDSGFDPDTLYRGGQPKLLDSHQDQRSCDSRQGERSEDEGSSEDSEDEDSHQSSVFEDTKVTKATTLVYREVRRPPPPGDCVWSSRIKHARTAAAQSTALPGREGNRPQPPPGDYVWANRFNPVPVRIAAAQSTDLPNREGSKPHPPPATAPERAGPSAT